MFYPVLTRQEGTVSGRLTNGRGAASQAPYNLSVVYFLFVYDLLQTVLD